ncbi:MAG: hypothetical protein C5B50_06585 [Verrucomicrobia bacterium]|nr:MAG: hypothetical protein C5B50_06585 [Verrucomicrobiota bacterium]
MIGFLRNLVLKDLLLKLFSLAMAILIWLLVSIANPQQQSNAGALGAVQAGRTFYNLPLSIMWATNQTRQFLVSPREVEVTVRGDTNALEKLQPADLRAMVVLSGTESAGAMSKKIEVAAPPGVTYVHVVPPEAQLMPR